MLGWRSCAAPKDLSSGFMSTMSTRWQIYAPAEDGIVRDQAAYIDLAVRLATDPARYKAFRDQVTPERWRQTLGDTPGFCRNLEAAFAQVVATLDR